MTETRPEPGTGREGPAVDADLVKDLASSLAWAFQSMVIAAAFCAITVLGHGDVELIATSATGVVASVSSVDVPLLGLKLLFPAFCAVSPWVLVSIQFYLWIQANALLKTPGGTTANGLMRNHIDMWPLSLLSIALYVLVPATILVIFWKISALRYAGQAWFLNVWQVCVLLAFALSALLSALAQGVDWRHRHLFKSRLRFRLVGGLLGGVLVVGFAVAGWQGLHRGMNLRNTNLAGGDLRRYDLTGADLTGADLRTAILSGVQFARATLEEANLEYADLRGANLADTELLHARMDNADLRGSCLAGGNLESVSIQNADLRYAWMLGAYVQPQPAIRRLQLKDIAGDNPPAPPEEPPIKVVRLEDAKLCGAEVVPAKWANDADVGTPSKLGGPYYVSGDWDGTGMPKGLQPTPYPAATQSGSDLRSRNRLACVAHLPADVRSQLAQACRDYSGAAASQ